MAGAHSQSDQGVSMALNESGMRNSSEALTLCAGNMKWRHPPRPRGFKANDVDKTGHYKVTEPRWLVSKRWSTSERPQPAQIRLDCMLHDNGTAQQSRALILGVHPSWPCNKTSINPGGSTSLKSAAAAWGAARCATASKSAASRVARRAPAPDASCRYLRWARRLESRKGPCAPVDGGSSFAAREEPEAASMQLAARFPEHSGSTMRNNT
eukprot:scaffold121498_cov30-Tisochrysis_lutea.AAC.1